MDQRDLAAMPRGGFDASWLDLRLQTGRPEYLDGDDDSVKRQVIRSLDVMGRVLRDHARFAARALEVVADIPEPKILELGAGHGGLTRELLKMHPRAHVTVTDIDPISLSDMAAGDLGSHPRVTVRRMDATNIDAPDRSYDLALFALSFHHLPPVPAAEVLSEGTRTAGKLLICDLRRPPALLHLIRLATFLPFALAWPFAHDGLISSMRAYGPSGFRTLAAYVGPDIAVEFSRLGRNQIVLAQRRSPGPSRSS